MNPVENLKIVPVIAPGVIKDNASFTVIEIDAIGAGRVTIVVQLGATDIAFAALKLKESDTASDGAATDVPGADFSVSPATLPSADDDGEFVAIQVPMLGRKRYLTLVATAGDGSAGTYASAFAILSDLAEAPYGAAARGFGQELIAG